MAFPTIRRLVSRALNQPAPNRTKEPALNDDLLSPATGPISVRCRHLRPAVAAQVEAWFRGEVTERKLSGDRCVIIAHPEDPGLRLKIKGAGFRGEQLQFDRLHASNLIAPHFDFDGRMMRDEASSHHIAYRGGASFQQAVIEYDVTARLDRLGFPTVPCPGYGSVNREGRTSWFSVFEWEPEWTSLILPDHTMEVYAEGCLRYGRDVIELATNHNLIGYFWYAAKPGGSWYLKDLHPFYAADPLNRSELSWTMQTFFALHMVSLSAIHLPQMRDRTDRPPGLQAYPFRAFAPGASRDEHEALRHALVGPYMRRVPSRFDRGALRSLLQEHRLTRELMALCPPEYADASPEC